MNKQAVIEQLCGLVSEVGRRVFKDELPHDCFCQLAKYPKLEQVHPEITAYIVGAVIAKMQRDHIPEDGA